MRKHWGFALCLALAALLISGCSAPAKKTLTIAEQFGIAYAPLQVMKQEGTLEKALPGVTIQWVQMGGPTAIREGMLAGQIDVGFMGIGPMLIGVDTGMHVQRGFVREQIPFHQAHHRQNEPHRQHKQRSSVI